MRFKAKYQEQDKLNYHPKVFASKGKSVHFFATLEVSATFIVALLEYSSNQYTSS